MVHPYLRRRRGEEPVDFPSDALGAVLGKTLGVPLFQEQAMQIAIVGAGFTPEEADRLRRALATFKKTGTIHTFRERFLAGMAANGYRRDFAERCFSQIEGFGDYGFPESHAASFALLVYASAWLKCHHPAVFACALLNTQPMGFYAPAQIVRDAREHGVVVRPVCVNASYWDSSAGARRRAAGWRCGSGSARSRGCARTTRPGSRRRAATATPTSRAVWRRAGRGAARCWRRWPRPTPSPSLGLDRRDGAVAGAGARRRRRRCRCSPGSRARGRSTGRSRLPAMTLGEEVVADYTALRLTLRAHPMALLRPRLDALCARGTGSR